jgi:hypothetical protein
MGGGVCNNDRRYPEKILVRSHVSSFQFHGLPKDQQLRKIWHDKIRQGRQNYIESAYIKIHVCSNHCKDEERTFGCSVPTSLLTKSDVKPQQWPHKCCHTLGIPEDNGKKSCKIWKCLCQNMLQSCWGRRTYISVFCPNTYVDKKWCENTTITTNVVRH